MSDTLLSAIVDAVTMIDVLIGQMIRETDPEKVDMIHNDIKNINERLIIIGEQLEEMIGYDNGGQS